MTETRIPTPETGDIWQDFDGTPHHVTNVTRAGIIYGKVKGKPFKVHISTWMGEFHPLEMDNI